MEAAPTRQRAAALSALLVAFLLLMGVAAVRYGPTVRESMLILRGIAGENAPKGQLDDAAALEYARRLGYASEVLDVASDTGPQVRMALERIRNDTNVTALYGFSGGGYNAQTIWAQLSAQERGRIKKIVIVGSPGVGKQNFPGSEDVVVQEDPPEGHMAGPKMLLQSASRS
jgi:hypothetical protein